MLPLRDQAPTLRTPAITIGLIVLNILAFGLELASVDTNAFIVTWGFVPARLLAGEPMGVLGLLTSQFLHAGFAHIGMNLWYLHIFGDNVEEALGRGRYLAFYLTAGVAAALAQLLSDPQSTIPMIGASGAIAGVLGAYLALFPKNRIITLIPGGGITTLPSALVLGSWFVLQLFSGTASIVGGGEGGGVAFWAHAGGFAFGWIVARIFVTRPTSPT
jgi:membrane associated rhomboid family serine protease